MTLRLLFFITSLSFGAHLAVGQQLCTGFGTGVVQGEYIKEHFSEAVVRIQDVGTAYLIDAEHGYLLTAGHVLDDLDAKKEPHEILVGESPSQHLGFVVTKRPENLDIALLQLTKTDALKDVRALDIAFVAPDFDSFLFVMGYPQYGQQNQVFLRAGSAKLDSYTPNGLIEIAHVTAGGSSGGPLIDANGDAVAVCQEEIADQKVGRYLPLSEIKDFLDNIPTSPRMQSIDSDLSTGKMGMDDFKRLLRKGNSQGPTNLELFVWLHNLKPSSPSWIAIKRKYITCPLFPALIQRQIPDALFSLLAQQDSSDPQTSQAVAQAKLAVAEREYAIGNQSVALELTHEIYFLGPEKMIGVSGHSDNPFEKANLLRWAIEEQGELVNKEKLRYQMEEQIESTQQSVNHGRSQGFDFQVVKQQLTPVNVTLDSHVVEKYLVHWLATISYKKGEDGHPAEPLKGWLTDTRKCHWTIQSEVLRKLYYINAEGQPATYIGASRIFHSGFGNQGSDFVLTQLRPENCQDEGAVARYMSDLHDARTAVSKKFASVIVEDRKQLARELGKLPHVANVSVLSSDQAKQ
jgi:hypothetical protein